jgi:hypothetical protein
VSWLKARPRPLCYCKGARRLPHPRNVVDRRATLYATSPAESCGGHSTSDYYVDPNDRNTLIDALLDRGRIDDFRVRQYDADDGVFWASLSARLIDFQGRQVIVSNATNISDMIAAQEQTRQANARLIDAIESLGGIRLYDCARTTVWSWPTADTASSCHKR